MYSGAINSVLVSPPYKVPDINIYPVNSPVGTATTCRMERLGKYLLKMFAEHLQNFANFIIY